MKLQEQSIAGICPAAIFQAKLADKPLKLSGMWPPSTDIDARSKIALALLRAKWIVYNHPSAGTAFSIGDYPIQIGGTIYKPGDPFKLTWIDYEEIDKEFAHD